MPKAVTKSVAKLERLSTALNAYQCAARAARSGDFSKVVAEIRETNRLYDVAVDCGMEIGTPDLEGWAAEAVANFLRRAA